MTSKKEKIFDSNSFEQLLIKDWTYYLDIRKTIQFLKEIVEKNFNLQSFNIQTIKVSNAIFTNNGINIWIDFIVMNSNTKVNLTAEFKLEEDDLKFIKII